jgi:hypothetical protein
VSRALVTFATGDFGALFTLTRPTFRSYADQHGYHLHDDPPGMLLRPPSWMKVARLLDALAWHDEALWIDADVAIVDESRDIADEVPADAWQALVRHHTPDGEVPNCGVWYVRAPMRPVLEQVWRMDRYLDHPWWEQAALLDLLGYRHETRPVELDAPSPLYERTHWLGLEWNSHEQNDRHDAPRFAHATAGSVEWRENVLRDYLTRTLASTKGD